MATQVEDIKWLPSNSDRRFIVDGFNFKTPACQTYFLTHFHSDHTTGLTKRFDLGLVYTSEITARLLVHDMGLPEGCVRVLPMLSPVLMHGCRITLLDANHCPGAIMLLIEVLYDRRGLPMSKAEVILHMGDCRWEDRLANQVPRGVCIDTLFMDTTYARPKYTFPGQDVVLDALAEEVRAMLAAEPRSLIVVASYHIGKEKVYLGLARRLGIKVWCSEAKRRVLMLLGLSAEDMSYLTCQPTEAGLHVSGWGMRPDQLKERFLKAAQTAGVLVQIDGTLDSETTGALPHADRAGLATQAAAVRVVKVESEGQDASTADEELLKLEDGDAPPLGFAYDGAEEEAGAAAACAGQWQRIIGIKATGWSFRKKGKLVSQWKAGLVTLLGAPYSEHSSYLELCSCVRLLKPSRIIPTVNAITPAASRAIAELFIPFMDLSKQRGRLDMYLVKAPTPTSLSQAPRDSDVRIATGGVTAGISSLKSTPSLTASRGEVVYVDLTDEVQPQIVPTVRPPCVRDDRTRNATACVDVSSNAGSHGDKRMRMQSYSLPVEQKQELFQQLSSEQERAGFAKEEEDDEGLDELVEEVWVQQRVLGTGPTTCGCFAKPQFADGADFKPTLYTHASLPDPTRLQSAYPHDAVVLPPDDELRNPTARTAAIGETSAVKKPAVNTSEQRSVALQRKEEEEEPQLLQVTAGAGAVGSSVGSLAPITAVDAADDACDAAAELDVCDVEAVDTREQQRIWDLIQFDRLRSQHRQQQQHLPGAVGAIPPTGRPNTATAADTSTVVVVVPSSSTGPGAVVSRRTRDARGTPRDSKVEDAVTVVGSATATSGSSRIRAKRRKGMGREASSTSESLALVVGTADSSEQKVAMPVSTPSQSSIRSFFLPSQTQNA